MAEQTSIVTLYRRKMLTQITSGAISALPKITHLAFGSGGLDEEGKPLTPSETQTGLNSEFCRYPIDSVTYPIETTARYIVTIPKGEQEGKMFNEIGLIDAEGNLCAVKTMYTKQKDGDVKFTFEFDDEF